MLDRYETDTRNVKDVHMHFKAVSLKTNVYV